MKIESSCDHFTSEECPPDQMFSEFQKLVAERFGIGVTLDRCSAEDSQVSYESGPPIGTKLGFHLYADGRVEVELILPDNTPSFAVVEMKELSFQIDS